MENINDILWIISIFTWAVQAMKAPPISYRFNETANGLTSNTLCNATCGILLSQVRLTRNDCLAQVLSYSSKHERNILLDIERRCNGKSRCEMDSFHLPDFHLSCNNTLITADNIDIDYWCIRSSGDRPNVHILSSSFNKSMCRDLDEPHYLIYNNTSPELNQIVCNIEVLANTNLTIQLLYVDWSRDCEGLKENISIDHLTYGCTTYGDKYKRFQHQKQDSVKIEIFKQLGLVWLQIEANKSINTDCQVVAPNIKIITNISTNSSTSTKPNESDLLYIYIVIPVCTLAVIFLVAILILYRLGFICKNPFKRIDTQTNIPITSDENGEYSTINDAARPTKRPSCDKVACFDADSQSLLLKQQKRHDKSNIEHQTSPTTVPRLRDNHYDEAEIETTYTAVNNNPRLTTLQVNPEQLRSMDNLDTQQNDNVYAHLQHLQNGGKQTEDVYNG